MCTRIHMYHFSGIHKWKNSTDILLKEVEQLLLLVDISLIYTLLHIDQLIYYQMSEK